MCTIYPSIWMKHLNKTGIIILKKWRFPFKANVMHRIEQEVWTLLKGAFHFSTYCMFLHSREDLVFRAIVLNKWSLSWKMVTLKNTIGRLSCLLEEISSRQIVTCKQHVPLTTFFFQEWNNLHRQQYWMLITHCILCRNLVYDWRTAWYHSKRNNFSTKVPWHINKHLNLLRGGFWRGG